MRLRYLAEVNPATPAFDQIPDDQPVTFMPLETVWADDRVDTSRSRPKAEVSTGYVRFVNGDILSPKVTPTFQAGRSALITTMTTPAGAASTEVHVVRVRHGLADPRFVRYGLLTKPFLEEGVSRFQGVAGLQRVPDEFLRDLALRTVDITGQRRIADFLDDQVARIDNIIAARSVQIGLIERLPWEQFSADVATTTEGHLPLRRVISFIADGPFGSAFSSADYVDEGPAVIRLGNIGFAEFRAGDLARVPVDVYDRFPRCHIEAGDLLIAGLGDARNHAGRACVAPESLGPAMVKGKCFRAQVNPRRAVPKFLARLLSSAMGVESLERLGRGSTRTMLNIDVLTSAEVPIPALGDQVAMMVHFDRRSAESVAAAQVVRQSVARLGELKASLITAAVTGEFDLSSADGSRVGV